LRRRIRCTGQSLLVVAYAAAVHAQVVITTIAGADRPFPNSSLSALQAPLGQTSGVAVDALGNVYVADQGNNMVMRVSPGGTLVAVAGNGNGAFSGDGGPALKASLHDPVGLAVDAAGNLYIADEFNHRIRKVTPDGTITTVAGTGTPGFSGDGGSAVAAQLDDPHDVKMDAAGNLYIADSINQRVREVSPAGIISTIAGNGTAAFSGDGGKATAAALNMPLSIALDATGNLYISDSVNQRVRKVAPNGTISTAAGNGQTGFAGDAGPAVNAALNGPSGLSVDAQGNVYVADVVNNRIREISTGGIINTVAGNGIQRFSGDGGPAVAASLDTPGDVAVDGMGNVWIADTNSARIRVVSLNGTINTAAGNGGPFAGDGGPATGAVLNYPYGAALDGKGNVYIADTYNNRIRKVAQDGTISTVAGNGIAGFTGDGGAALSAELNTPSGISLDSAGNIYIADTYNDRVRRVSTAGVITTIAGSGSTPGFGGDGGPAVAATLYAPRGVVAQGGNVFVADSRNNRVREILPSGVINTVAGTGVADFGGDGGPAVDAGLNAPSAVVLDASGNLYIADTLNNRVRMVTPAGTITTFAGNGVLGFSGNGGPGVQAEFNYPTGLTADPAGNRYIVDSFNCQVRKVTADGNIATFAGNGNCQFSGDGGSATSASLNYPFGITTDGAGNFYIADNANGRIREVLAPGAVIPFQATPTTISFTANSGGTAPSPQTITLSSLVPGLAYSSANQSSWLTINPSSGSIPASLNASVNPAGLAPGTYSDTIIITVPNATPPQATIPVTFTVGSAQPPVLNVDVTALNFSFVQGAQGPGGQIHVSNSGSGSVTFTTAAVSGSNGGSWLSVSPASGVVTPSSPAILTVSVNTASLNPGSYQGSIILATATTTTTISVTLLVTAPQALILLSQTGLSFRAAAGGTPLPQSFAILNAASGSMAYSATATVLSGGNSWLSISPSNGTVQGPLLGVSPVQVSVNPSGLSPGDYFGRIDVTSAASNTPQTVTVVLTVVQPGVVLEPDVEPIGLVFTGEAGVSPGSQDVLVGNPTPQPNNYLSAPIGATFTYQPSSAQLLPEQPQTLRVYPDFTNVTPGVQHGTIALQFSDGTARTISILTVVGPDSSGGGQSAGRQPFGANAFPADDGCTPTQLNVTFTSLGDGNPVPVGYPVTIQVAIVDDCGSPLTSGAVQAAFNNGDPLLSLVSLQNGSWAGTWLVGHPSSSVQITVTAKNSASGLIGMTQASTGEQGEPAPLPVLSGAGLVSAASLLQGSFAPGDVMLIRGSSLADGAAQATSTPLQQQLAGAAVSIGGKLAPLLYADSNEILALVPSDLPANSPQALLLQRDDSLSVQVGVTISAVNPGILTQNGSGTGQALIYGVNGAAATTLADASNAVNPGASIILYCTGLGATDQNGNVVNPVSVSIGGQAAAVSYAGVALGQAYPSAGAPILLGGLASSGLGGLYQITATVPQSVGNGTVPVIVSSAGQQSSQAGVTMVVSGGSVAPSITSIDTAGGFPNVAQNDWIEIKGSNLAPASVGVMGMTWSTAPSFNLGMLPTQLGGVSVTVDGKAAFVYYISTTQVNVLTPLDGTTGQVQVVVTVAGVSSAPFTVTLGQAAPSFFLFYPTRYIAATHADGTTLVGPASMSSPGYPFLPAQPGETIVLYAAGFGLTNPPLTNGASSQTGTLPSPPSIQIGGIEAVVRFAGVTSAGLYQFNVIVPSALPNGDSVVTCTYQGLSTPASDMLSIQQ
jgi:uncharacterized protein (TIGR03437 family)